MKTALFMVFAVFGMCVAQDSNSAQVEGTVRISDSEKMVSGAVVRLTPISGSPSGSVYFISETGVDGKYQISQVPLGDYIFEVLAAKQLAYRGSISVNSEQQILKNIMLTTAGARPTFQVSILDADDDVRVVLNGENILRWSAGGRSTVNVPLRPGGNHIEVYVYNKGSFTGGVAIFGGHKREGWRYSILFRLQNSRSINVHGQEDRPPPERHGKEFSVCQMDINIDSTGAWVLSGANTPLCSE